MRIDDPWRRRMREEACKVETQVDDISEDCREQEARIHTVRARKAERLATAIDTEDDRGAQSPRLEIGNQNSDCFQNSRKDLHHCNTFTTRKLK